MIVAVNQREIEKRPKLFSFILRSTRSYWAQGCVAGRSRAGRFP